MEKCDCCIVGEIYVLPKSVGADASASELGTVRIFEDDYQGILDLAYSKASGHGNHGKFVIVKQHLDRICQDCYNPIDWQALILKAFEKTGLNLGLNNDHFKCPVCNRVLPKKHIKEINRIQNFNIPGAGEKAKASLEYMCYDCFYK